MSAIFISHSSKDNAAAQQIAAWLRQKDFESIFLDFDPQFGIPAGRDWEKELYRQLRVCRAVLVLCSEHFVASDWCFAEVVMARSLGKSLFPVLIGPCKPPPLLSDRQIIDFTQQPDQACDRLWLGLTKAGLDPRDTFQWDTRRPPYPGLLAFQEKDAAIFFGRDDAIRAVLDALNNLRRYGGKNLLMLLGASGSGKSSLVRAGIVPRLRHDPDDWLVIDPFRPGTDPFLELGIVLAAAFARHGESRDHEELAARLRLAANARPVHADDLRQWLDRLRTLAGQRQTTAVLILDQFEELLSSSNSPKAAGFLEWLRSALETEDIQLLLLATLRSDDLGTFQGHPALLHLPFDQVMVGPMGVESYTRIIEDPAAMAGLTLEPGLTELMVKETSTGDALPLLAFTLRELWESFGRSDGEVSIEEYSNKLHGLLGSVQRAADGVLNARPLSTGELNDLRQAFLAMTRINEAGQYARRSVGWDEVPPACREILERFVDARLLVSGRENGIIEVAHESLLRNWPLLKGWLDENREFLLWRQRLQAALAEYDRNRTLLRDAQLQEAERWRATTRIESAERKLIDASLEARRRQRRLLLQAQLGAVAVVTAFTAAIWWQLQAARAAQFQQFEASHRALLVSDPLHSAVYGLAAMGKFLDRPGIAHQLSGSLADALNNDLAFTAPIPTGQEGVRNLVVLRNGDLLSAGESGTFRRWRDGKPVGAIIATGQGGVSSLLEQRCEIISGGTDGSLRRWRDGKPIGAPIPTGQGAVASLVELSNGEIISGGTDGSLRRWRDGRPLGPPIATGQGAVSTLVELSNGELISGGEQGSLRRWRDGMPVGQPMATGQGEALSLVALNNGELISGGVDGSLRRWRDGKPIGAPIPTGQGPVFSLVALRHGDLISGGKRGSLRRWRQGKPIGAVIPTGQGAVWSLVELPNGELISGGANGSLRRWRHGPLIGQPYNGGQGTVWSLLKLRDGHLISGSENGSLLQWRDGKPLGLPITTGQSSVLSLVELSNGEIVSGGADGSLRRWRDGKPVGPPLPTGQTSVESLLVLPNGVLVSGGGDGSLRLWRGAKPLGEPIATGQGQVWSLAALSNGELISGGENGSLRRWREGRAVGGAIVPGNASVMTLLSMRNGELVSGDRDGNLRRWRDGKPVGNRIATGQDAIKSLVELANGELVSGGADGSLRRWRDGMPLGEPIVTHQEAAESLVLLDNGVLVSGGRDGSLRQFSPLQTARAACRELGWLLVKPTESAEREAGSLCQQLGLLG